MTATTLDYMGVDPEDGAAGDRAAGTPSVTKALQLLEVFRDADAALGVSRIARLAGVPKSTAHRLLAYLERAGYVEREGRGYVLGRHLFELGNSVLMCRPSGLREVAMPYMSQLFAEHGKVVHLAVLDGTEVVYLEKIFGLDSVPVPTVVGGRMPAACSAVGKAMLAFSDRQTVTQALGTGLVRLTPYSHTSPGRLTAELRRIRAERVAYDREESRVGLVCAAAPILRGGRAVAAVSMSTKATRCDLAALGNDVRRAAAAISRDLVGDLAA
jgi:IclR family KDG regulon transcriptional repressor